MASDSRLEETIDKILTKTESNSLSSLKTSLDESEEILSKSKTSLEQEYDRILDEGKKESEKLEKQIVGSSDLDSRNKHLVLIQESIEKAFENAIKKIGSTERNDDYSKLISTLLDDSIKALGTSEVIVYANSKDQKLVKSALSKFPGSKLSSDKLDCLGGVEIKSKDGTTVFTNTIDARIERMKPLIRKEVASKFGKGN